MTHRRKHRHHRHHGSIGGLLGRLAIDIGMAMLKQKMAENQQKKQDHRQSEEKPFGRSNCCRRK